MATKGELEYINLVNRIIARYDRGEKIRSDRTGTGTISEVGVSIKYDLSGGKLPLFRCKFTPFRKILLELLWFLSGSTDAGELSKKGVKFWNANGSREFLDSMRLCNNREGDLGPVYGFQWRHFGAEYEGPSSTAYEGKGVDQIARCIDIIKEDPSCRRNLVSAWNPPQLNQMALPPCHVMFHMICEGGDDLSCVIYQRSGDLGIGVPFNVASYAILTHLMAHLTLRKAKTLTHVIGDAHLYSNHFKGMRAVNSKFVEQTTCPTLSISEDAVDIDKLLPSYFTIKDYVYDKRIRLEMAL